MSLQIYVKPNSFCDGMNLTTFKPLSKEWSGRPKIWFQIDGDRQFLNVSGLSSLFGGIKIDCHIVKVVNPDPNGNPAYLVYGADFGLDIETEDGDSFGMPIVWIEHEEDLPEEVVTFINQNLLSFDQK